MGYGYLACFFVIFFGIPLFISGEFVIIPINKTAKKFQQKYHDSQEEKRKYRNLSLDFKDPKFLVDLFIVKTTQGHKYNQGEIFK